MSCTTPPDVSAGPKEGQASQSSNNLADYYLIWNIYQQVHNISIFFVAICVAGFSAGQNNEILQLAIPEKLLPVSEQVRHLSLLYNNTHMHAKIYQSQPYWVTISMPTPARNIILYLFPLCRHFVLGETSK
jgi:hypothetical protein